MQTSYPKIFIAKNGQEIILRPPETGDIDELLRYVNVLSQEDTFITMSGEIMTREQEEENLKSWLQEMVEGNRIHLLAFAGVQLVGVAEIKRITKSRTRSLHVGEVAISIAKDWRGLGIGKNMLKKLIDDSRRSLDLKLLKMTAFATNQRAITLYKQLGFRIAGEIPAAIKYKGKFVGQKYLYLPLTGNM